MTEHSEYSKEEGTLAWLEAERTRARRLRKIGYAAWTVTFVVLALYAVIVGIQATRVIRDGVQLHLVFSPKGLDVLLHTIGPLLVVVGVTALLIAALSTIGIFVRMRTATLAEIQLRLAALERSLTREED